MQFKNIFQLALLAFVPAVFAAKECNVKDMDDSCNADVLIVTTVDKVEDEGYKSVLSTLQRFAVPTNKYEINKNGVSTNDIKQVIYKDEAKKLGRYKAIVFPNGRVSYSSDGGIWASALDKDQWEVFEQYTAVTDNRIVFLNEYPSENTGTLLANDTATGQNFSEFTANQAIIVEGAGDGGIADELNKNNLNTMDTWHFPAVIDPQANILGFETIEPLMTFEAYPPKLPESTVAAVACKKTTGAQFAAFFLSFGQWSKTSAALNVYWLTWALNTDISKISDRQISTDEAIKMASDAPRSTKLGMALLLSTLSAIVLALF